MQITFMIDMFRMLGGYMTRELERSPAILTPSGDTVNPRSRASHPCPAVKKDEIESQYDLDSNVVERVTRVA